MERVVGIEPTFPAWKAGVLPIYDTRIYSLSNIIITMERKTGFEPAASTLARWHSTVESFPLIFGADEESRTLTPLGARS